MSGRSKGFGFVTFANDEDAKKAIAELDGKEFQGRNMKVNEAKPMEERPQRRSFGRRY
jgi:RNA recognition motif-containing protein